MFATAPATAADTPLLASPDSNLVILAIAGTVIGVIVGWILRGRQGAGAEVRGTVRSGQEEDAWPLEEIGDRHLGFVLARPGEVPRVSLGIRDLLSGRHLEFPGEEDVADHEQWLAGVDADDRSELREMLSMAEAEPDRVLQIRVRVPDSNVEVPGAWPWSIRWFEVRRTGECRNQVELALVDQTEQVLDDQRRMIQLRNQRLLTRMAQRITDSEDFTEAVSEVLPALGEGLNLLSAGWYMEQPESAEVHWDLQAAWGSNEDQGLPVHLEGIGEEPEPGGGSTVGRPGHPNLLLLPVVAGQRTRAVLGLESHGGDQWSGDTVEMLDRLGGLLGRRFEQETIDEEREAWAATRGAFERSESIAQLTGGVAHDFNGVLFAVLGRFELLRDRIRDDEVLDQLDEISQTLQEARRLADRLIQALRPAGDPLPLDVRVEAEEIGESIRRLLPKRLEFDFSISLPPPVRSVLLVARINDLQRIIFNLVINARDAVGTHGRIHLGTRLVENGMLEIRIDDDGPGIDEADRDRMLQPYETGEHSDGVGLGLAVCRRTAEELGGTLVLDDSPLGGLAARVMLPVRIESEADGSGPDEGGGKESGSIGRALVIEDNPIIRDVLIRVLEDMGAEVRSQGHALGVEELVTEEEGFDILVFDIDLPERTGIDCLRDLRGAGVETPCLLITGGTREAPTSMSGTDFLRKPFRIEELRKAILGLISRRSGD